MKHLFTLLFLGTSIGLFAQNLFPVTDIPDSLKKNAEAVIRSEEMIFESLSPSKAEQHYKLVVTVMNKNGDHYADLGLYYDKLQSVNSIKATVYDASGKKIKEYGKNQFLDKNYISDFSVFEDNRIKTLTVYENTYPYTIAFEYEKTHKGVLAYPVWAPLSQFDVSCQKSSYKLIAPAGFNVSYLESGSASVKNSALGTKKVWYWETSNLPAFEYEPLSAGIANLVPRVITAPEVFEYDGYQGSQKNWKDLGKWYHTISAGRQVLPQNIKDEVKALLKTDFSDHQKIAVLYKYMQSRMRYVSIQLGIGGQQPMSAQSVASLNYGDCKALSNYMMALLMEAGIKSNLVILYGSDSPRSIHPIFSSVNQGNHMILSVPLQKDTVWLECTSQRLPPNYLGSFTGNRNVLMVGDDGGKIVKTPAYSAEDNMQDRTGKVKIDDTGNATANIITTYANEQYETVFYQQFKSKKDQKEDLLNSITVSDPNITSFAYLPVEDKPVIKEDINLIIEKLLTPAGERFFLSPNLLNKKLYAPQIVEKRKTDFMTPINYLDRDTIEYELPANMAVEYKPEDVALKSEFGEYRAIYKVEGNKITYIRVQRMNNNRYPPSKYNDYIAFYKAVTKADKSKILIKKI